MVYEVLCPARQATFSRVHEQFRTEIMRLRNENTDLLRDLTASRAREEKYKKILVGARRRGRRNRRDRRD